MDVNVGKKVPGRNCVKRETSTSVDLAFRVLLWIPTYLVDETSDKGIGEDV